MNKKKFDIIIFLGRPAAGKSEVIDFLKRISFKERLEKYYMGSIAEMDDFKFLWQRGEKDDQNESRDLARQDTEKIDIGGYKVLSQHIYLKLIEDINQYYCKNYNSNQFFLENTLFIEFSRGGEKGYLNSLQRLDREILERAIIYYIDASYQEVIKKNKRRYDPDKPDSILHHIVPFEVMELYKTDDWYQLTENKEYIEINNIRIPYAVFHNEPEKTNDDIKIKNELLRTIDRLFIRYAGKGD